MCLLAPHPRVKATVPWGCHSRAGTKADGDGGALPCCQRSLLSSPPVNPAFKAAEHPEENGTSGRAAPGTGWCWPRAARGSSQGDVRGSRFAGRGAGSSQRRGAGLGLEAAMLLEVPLADTGTSCPGSGLPRFGRRAAGKHRLPEPAGQEDHRRVLALR